MDEKIIDEKIIEKISKMQDYFLKRQAKGTNVRWDKNYQAITVLDGPFYIKVGNFFPKSNDFYLIASAGAMDSPNNQANVIIVRYVKLVFDKKIDQQYILENSVEELFEQAKIQQDGYAFPAARVCVSFQSKEMKLVEPKPEEKKQEEDENE